MNAPRDDQPDIRKGDLVRATRKDAPEQTAQGRVDSVAHDYIQFDPSLFLTRRKWTFEVLDRPLPLVEEELLRGATREWQNVKYNTVTQALAAVINFTREYDRNNNKESK